MRDIDLWRKLSANELDDELAELLEELPRESIRARAPFYARLLALLDAPDERLRGAATRALAGVRGKLGVDQIVRMLDDPSELVRTAAVDALRSTADDAPARWAHAIFHPRSEVRAAALAHRPPTHAAHLGIYLRTDPDNAEAARKAPWPQRSLDLLFDLLRRGAASPDEAAQRLVRCDTNELRGFLHQSYRRTAEQVSGFIDDASRGSTLPVAQGVDILDEWYRIAVAVDERAAITHALAEAALHKDDDTLRRRVLVAVLDGGLDTLAHEGAVLCAACEPRFLTFEAIPEPMRRAGALGLFRHRARIGRLPKSSVERLLDLPLVRHPDGRLDLRVVVSISSLRKHDKIKSILGRFGVDEITGAALADLDGWSMLCQLPAETGNDAHFLLTLIEAHAPDRWPDYAAIALGLWAPSASQRFHQTMASLDPRRATEVLVALADLDRRGVFRPSDTAINRVLSPLLELIPIGSSGELLAQLLGTIGDSPGEIARKVVNTLAQNLDAKDFARVAAGLAAPHLEQLVGWLDTQLELALSIERELARQLEASPVPAISAWATRVLNVAQARPAERRVSAPNVHRLTNDEMRSITAAAFPDLDKALAPAIMSPTERLCDALALRSDPPGPHLTTAVALLAAHDPLAEVGAQFERHASTDEWFTTSLTSAAVTMWQGNTGLPPLGNAWLCNWESHGLALLNWATTQTDGLLGALRLTLDVPSATVRRKLWRGIASTIVLLRYRSQDRLAELVSEDLAALWVAQLDTELGVYAAKMLVAVHLAELGEGWLEKYRETAFELGPDMDDETRRELERWARLDGLPTRATAARESRSERQVDLVARIRGSSDLEFLVETLRKWPRAAHEATLRIIELGVAGEQTLVDLLAESPRVANASVIVESVPLWSDPECLDRARDLARSPDTHPELRYRLALAFRERGERGWLDPAVEAARAPCSEAWFTRKDWDSLAEIVDSTRLMCMRLADSPHPHAYQRAVAYLLEHANDANALAALLRFLEAGTKRPLRLRREAAQKLWLAGQTSVLPVIVEHVTDPDEPIHSWLIERGDGETLADVVLDACLVGGPGVLREETALHLIEGTGLRGAGLADRLGRLFTEGVDPVARQRITNLLGPADSRDDKLRSVAEIFAWGVRRGRELTGKLFRVHMTSRREDFGYTHLDQNRIYVSPLAILTGDPKGKDIVEALVLHEFGHHVHHAGEGAAAIWKRAQSEGLFPLLNVVADEHLERNLRALEPEYGDRLKRLAAYAFQHAEREIAIAQLLNMLMGAAFEALSSQSLGVAYHEDSVVVQRGVLLRELDRIGHPFARFVRALRMGLGNRHGDPLVAEALELFKGGFRRSDMQQLWEITLRLAQLFGGAASLARTFGGHETLEWDERQAGIHGAGIDDDDVQREVERILDPRQKSQGSGTGKPGKLAINVIPDATFDLIETIERIPDDPGKHRQVALAVRRDANRLREYLTALGLALVPRRARLRGRSFDRTRAKAVVLRRDPRMLVAREIEVHNDLFIGVAIDCSGSMSVGDSMNKAHHFGVMLAEAVRPLAGVDARFFGFTDSIIFDAGDDQRCAVASLEPQGGNNDAAALYHVARIAEGSRRKAKILVMISDGLPTECSVAALRNLVDQLGRRRGLLCAQVAVRPLEEVCFPHYVEVIGSEVDALVRRFGEIISGLARRALGR